MITEVGSTGKDKSFIFRYNDIGIRTISVLASISNGYLGGISWLNFQLKHEVFDRVIGYSINVLLWYRDSDGLLQERSRITLDLSKWTSGLVS